MTLSGRHAVLLCCFAIGATALAQDEGPAMEAHQRAERALEDLKRIVPEVAAQVAEATTAVDEFVAALAQKIAAGHVPFQDSPYTVDLAKKTALATFRRSEDSLENLDDATQEMSAAFQDLVAISNPETAAQQLAALQSELVELRDKLIDLALEEAATASVLLPQHQINYIRDTHHQEQLMARLERNTASDDQLLESTLMMIDFLKSEIATRRTLLLAIVTRHAPPGERFVPPVGLALNRHVQARKQQAAAKRIRRTTVVPSAESDEDTCKQLLPAKSTGWVSWAHSGRPATDSYEEEEETEDHWGWEVARSEHRVAAYTYFGTGPDLYVGGAMEVSCDLFTRRLSAEITLGGWPDHPQRFGGVNMQFDQHQCAWKGDSSQSTDWKPDDPAEFAWQLAAIKEPTFSVEFNHPYYEEKFRVSYVMDGAISAIEEVLSACGSKDPDQVAPPW